MSLIDIDQDWALIEGVLIKCVSSLNINPDLSCQKDCKCPLITGSEYEGTLIFTLTFDLTMTFDL